MYVQSAFIFQLLIFNFECIFQPHGTVEYKFVGSRLFVYVEVSYALELQVGERRQCSYILFYICLLYTSDAADE